MRKNYFWILLLFILPCLAGAGSISGQVTDSSGNALIAHYIELYSWDGNSLTYQNSISTDEQGKYLLSDIDSGEYYLEFSDFSGPYLEQGYATEIPLEENCMAYQIPLSINADSNLTNLNAQLTLGGSITGRVTNPSGAGIPDVYVFADIWDGTTFIRQASIPRTDAEGFYSVVGLSSGDYYLHFEKEDSIYLSQGYLDEIPFQYGTISQKTPITIESGQELSNIDAQLTYAGSISGRVTNSSGQGIPGVYVFADTWDGSAFIRQFSIPQTDANGYYTVPDLVSGDYYLHFEKEDSLYLSKGYEDEVPFQYGNIDHKTVIRIQTGQNFTDIDVQLPLAASISGRVTDANGNGIAGVYVFADTWDGTSFIRQASIPQTNTDGYYTVPGLVSGDYFLHFEKPDSKYLSLGYIYEIPFEYGSIENKTALRISTGQIISNLNVQLVEGQQSSTTTSIPIPTTTPIPAQPPTATINSIVGEIITVTPGTDDIQLNKTGDTPKVQNVLVMLTDQQSQATIERESKIEIVMQEKTIAILHPKEEGDSIVTDQENEPITLIRGTITSKVNCSNYQLRTALANLDVANTCSCFRNSSQTKHRANSQTNFSTSYQQSERNGLVKISVLSGSVEITDREGNTSTLAAGQEKEIENIVPRSSWVLPIDGDRLYGGKSNMLVWTAYPGASSYILEYNLPSPFFAEENSSNIEFSNQTIAISPTSYSEYDGLVIYNLPLPTGLDGTTVEVRIFAIDSLGNILAESVSSDKSTVVWKD